MISILYHIITKTAIPLYQNCGFYLANDYNFDTKIIVRGNLGMNCQALYNGNYNNLLKFELHILMLGFQVSDHLFCYRLKSTTENNVLARARANDKRKTNPCLQVCISADKCVLRFPRLSKRYRSNILLWRNETFLDCKNKRCILSGRKTLALNSEQICKCFSLCRDQ